MIRTDPGSRSLGSDPGIRFRDPRSCLLVCLHRSTIFSLSRDIVFFVLVVVLLVLEANMGLREIDFYRGHCFYLLHLPLITYLPE